MTLKIRTRFAPSPTGHLHIGGARTALFNWLYARQHNGVFILRVEDSDVQRSTDESMAAILEGMRWLGLDWDEGPYYQSERFTEYKERAMWLLDKGLAYRCYCTAEELEERRKKAMNEGRPPMYDKRCRDSEERPGLPFAVRFRVPEGVTSFKDGVKGDISFDNSAIEDLIILRSDGTPTYNLCVVVDDASMGITEVIRGDDHINNTPKQILLYSALGFTIPAFAHLPMILGEDRTRLSKRHGATSVMAYKDMGILPEALVNYLARLGWSHGDEEIFSLKELKKKFTLETVGKSSGVFNSKKLLWLNQHYIQEKAPEDLKEIFLWHLSKKGFDASGDKRVLKIIKTLQSRSITMEDMAADALFYFKESVDYDEKAARKFLTPEKTAHFAQLLEGLSNLTEFSEASIEAVFTSLMESEGLKLGKLAQPVRVALTGGVVSPGIFETIEAMGKDLTIRRLKEAADFVAEKAAGV
ncbi:MAG: glutamate--tRNA ligase [Thermodesulfobacteriota bacterium]